MDDTTALLAEINMLAIDAQYALLYDNDREEFIVLRLTHHRGQWDVEEVAQEIKAEDAMRAAFDIQRSAHRALGKMPK